MGSKSFAIGDPDYAFDLQEVSLLVGRMWLGAKSATLLLNAWNDLVERCYNEYWYDIALTRLTSNSDSEALARDAEFLAWLKPRLEWHEGFIAMTASWRRSGSSGSTGALANMSASHNSTASGCAPTICRRSRRWHKTMQVSPRLKTVPRLHATSASK